MIKKFNKGMTLVELLITMVVAAILVSIALPSFKSMIDGSRTTATINGFIGFLQSARSEAIKRNTTVTVCRSTNGTSCATGTNWESGWIVFVDPDSDNIVEDIDGDTVIAKGFELLKTHGGVDVGTFRSTVNALNFSSKGRANASLTFTYCDPDAAEKLAVVVRESGRYGSSEVSHTGGALTCP